MSAVLLTDSTRRGFDSERPRGLRRTARTHVAGQLIGRLNRCVPVPGVATLLVHLPEGQALLAHFVRLDHAGTIADPRCTPVLRPAVREVPTIRARVRDAGPVISGCRHSMVQLVSQSPVGGLDQGRITGVGLPADAALGQHRVEPCRVVGPAHRPKGAAVLIAVEEVVGQAAGGADLRRDVVDPETQHVVVRGPRAGGDRAVEDHGVRVQGCRCRGGNRLESYPEHETDPEGRHAGTQSNGRTCRSHEEPPSPSGLNRPRSPSPPCSLQANTESWHSGSARLRRVARSLWFAVGRPSRWTTRLSTEHSGRRP